MRYGPARLFIDSFAIGVVLATALLEAVLLLDLWGAGAALAGLGPLALTHVWLHASLLAAPVGTVWLLARAEG